MILAGATGLLVGLMVAGFETVTHSALEMVLSLPLALRAAFPGLGLLVAVGCLRLAGRGATPGSSDEYIRAFHRPRGLGLQLRDVPLRMLAAVATLGSGGSLGYEGPSIYAGAALGSSLQRRLHRFFTADDAKVLMVAGAAAGVSAIFKAPVTGLVFALEVPFQDDLARRMLLPAAISSAASYVVFAAIAGTTPILPIGGQPPFNLVDLGGAAAIGLAAGLLARLYILLMARAKRLSTGGHLPLRVAGSAAVIATTVVLGTLLSKDNLILGPGYDALRWSLDPKHALLAIVALGTLR
ncbi:MAG: chloride channel protein, partial [Acidimicrobiales bacterium]